MLRQGRQNPLDNHSRCATTNWLYFWDKLCILGHSRLPPLHHLSIIRKFWQPHFCNPNQQILILSSISSWFPLLLTLGCLCWELVLSCNAETGSPLPWTTTVGVPQPFAIIFGTNCVFWGSLGCHHFTTSPLFEIWLSRLSLLVRPTFFQLLLGWVATLRQGRHCLGQQQ